MAPAVRGVIGVVLAPLLIGWVGNLVAACECKFAHVRFLYALLFGDLLVSDFVVDLRCCGRHGVIAAAVECGAGRIGRGA
jgi:hypothetical protein